MSDGDECTYSLFKMREQEHDAKQGLYADGDTPGVAVPFIGRLSYASAIRAGMSI